MGAIQKCNVSKNQELEMQIAKQCAPLLTGIKISNLLNTHISNKEKIYKIFENSAINIKCIYFDNERISILLYKSDELLEYMRQPDIQCFMRHMGYENMNENSILDEFAIRFSTYMRKMVSFPHEMGILLGYPVEDVIGFIENKGRNSLYTGYWKVYSNLFCALNTFKKYNQAKEKVTHLVSHGVSIKNILYEYYSDNETVNLNQLLAI